MKITVTKTTLIEAFKKKLKEAEKKEAEALAAWIKKAEAQKQITIAAEKKKLAQLEAMEVTDEAYYYYGLGPRPSTVTSEKLSSYIRRLELSSEETLKLDEKDDYLRYL